MPAFELVKIPTDDGLHLCGIHGAPPGATGIVLHVHGAFSNFYREGFIVALAECLADARMSFCSFNLRTHDCITEEIKADLAFEFAGGAVAEYESCLGDIGAAVRFFRARGYSRIVLQGHSLGCDRIIDYCLQAGSWSDPVVLISPIDAWELQRAFIAPESVDEQVSRLALEPRTQFVTDLLPPYEHGVRIGTRASYSPMTQVALLSHLRGGPCRHFRRDRENTWKLDLPALLCVGGRDALRCHGATELSSFFIPRFSAFTLVEEKAADHMFSGHESILGRTVASWITRQYSLATGTDSGHQVVLDEVR